MRIISSFRDYYDGLMDYTKDDYLNRLYLRETKTIKVNASKVKMFFDKELRIYPNSDNEVQLLYRVIILAGKVIPYIFTTYSWRTSWKERDNFKPSYYFTLEDFLKDFPEHKRKGSLNQLEKFFGELPDMTELCVELDTPIIMIRRLEIKNGLVEVEINSNLLELGINNLNDAQQMYQILDQFVSDTLVKDKMTARPLTDIEKLESKGFDKITSFRNVKR